MEQTLQDETQIRAEARQSYTGSRLTNAQFDEAWNIAGIIDREIHRSGSFIEKLTDYARTFAGREKVDASREEVILRDIYTARFGQTMNKTREALMGRETVTRDAALEQALHHARTVGTMIKDGPTMPFYQAYDRAALTMARQHGITETGAKSLMKDAFETAEGKTLYAFGKDEESKHHLPVRDAARTAKKAERNQQSRSGPQM